jgi:FkbM family methyltransferase
MKACEADCICDIGSLDGNQALLFRDLRPGAVVLAFEANPINFRTMETREALRAGRIEMFDYAISNQQGTATFHIADADYSDPKQNLGNSSLFLHKGDKLKESVEVETRRIDEFILEHCPHVRRIGLWIDAEGAEYFVVEGMAKIKERVLALHVETARTPIRQGQRTLAELLPLMETYGFEVCGSNLKRNANWGDVVFVNHTVVGKLGRRLQLCQFRAFASYWCKADQLAVLLKRRCPWLYGWLRRLFVRFWT